MVLRLAWVMDWISEIFARPCSLTIFKILTESTGNVTIKRSRSIFTEKEFDEFDNLVRITYPDSTDVSFERALPDRTAIDHLLYCRAAPIIRIALVRKLTAGPQRPWWWAVMKI
jgi:hypothetical protein